MKGKGALVPHGTLLEGFQSAEISANFVDVVKNNKMLIMKQHQIKKYLFYSLFCFLLFMPFGVVCEENNGKKNGGGGGELNGYSPSPEITTTTEFGKFFFLNPEHKTFINKRIQKTFPKISKS